MAGVAPFHSMAADLPQLNSLWIGPYLHPIHRLCLGSAVYHGHRVRLFSYGPLDGVPDGVELANAEEVMPKASMFLHAKTGSPAPFADRFRLKLIAMGFGAWVDTDVLFVKPLRSASPDIFGWEDEKLIGNAVLGLDPSGEILKTVSGLIEDDHFTPPWWSPPRLAWLRLREALGLSQHVSAMPYGTTGPDLLTWAIRTRRREHLAQSRQVFYPLPYRNKLEVFRKNSGWHSLSTLPDEVIAIHLWFQGLLGGLDTMKNGSSVVPTAERGSLLHEVAQRIGLADAIGAHG
jgi:hypothetical protein